MAAAGSPIEMSSSPLGTPPLLHWRSLCLQSFLGSSEAAESALKSFETITTNEAGSYLIDTAAAAASGLSSNTRHELQLAGLLTEDGFPVPLDAATYTTYIEARNAARSEAHKQLTAQRKRKLEECLERCPSRTTNSGSEVSLLRPPRMDDSAPRLRSFGRKFGHRQSIGTHPFLKGLLAFLKEQTSRTTLVQWVLKKEVLLEAGDVNFMEEACELLLRLLERGAPSEEILEAGDTGEHLLHWQLPIQASNRYIWHLIAQLPRDSALEGNASGEMRTIAIARTNVDGGADEDRLCLTGLLKCNLL